MKGKDFSMEKTTRLKRDLAYTGTILKIYRDTVVANGIEEVYDYIHHDGAAAVLPVTKDGKILMVRQYRNALDRETLALLLKSRRGSWMRRMSRRSSARRENLRRRQDSAAKPWNS